MKSTNCKHRYQTDDDEVLTNTASKEAIQTKRPVVSGYLYFQPTNTQVPGEKGEEDKISLSRNISWVRVCMYGVTVNTVMGYIIRMYVVTVNTVMGYIIRMYGVPANTVMGYILRMYSVPVNTVMGYIIRMYGVTVNTVMGYIIRMYGVPVNTDMGYIIRMCGVTVNAVMGYIIRMSGVTVNTVYARFRNLAPQVPICCLGHTSTKHAEARSLKLPTGGFSTAK